MNPILEKMLGSIIRHVLTLVVPFFVARGIWTPEEATGYVTAAVAAILVIGWSLWEKFSSQRNLVTALTMPANSTQAQVETKVKSGDTPPVTLQKNETPQ